MGNILKDISLDNIQNNEEYKRCFNRPQYIQMNLATGGNWAGDAGDNLAGQKYEIDYV